MATVGSADPLPPATRRRGRVAEYGFYVALLLATLLFWRTVRPVILPVIVGAFVAVLVRPSFVALSRRLGNSRNLAAAICTVAVLLLIVVPSFLLGWAVVQELGKAISGIAGQISDEGLGPALRRIPGTRRIIHILQLSPADLQRIANTAVTWSAGIAAQVLAGAAALAAGGFLLLVSLYYFLVDGERWFGDLQRLAPIERPYVQAFAHEFDAVSHGLFYGTVVTAVIQGGAAWLGYTVLEVPQPILWATVTAFMSLTPVVGTTVVWGPIAIVLLASGHPIKAALLLGWGALVIGSIDNIARPFLMKGRMRVHPLLIFLSVLGGLAAFGVVGILIGPMIAAIFLVAIRIYDRDYRQRLLTPDESTKLVTP